MIKILRTHRWVKLFWLFLTLKHLNSQRLCNHWHCLDYLTILKNKHTHTCRPKPKFHNCIQHTILAHLKSELISDNVGTAQQLSKIHAHTGG